MDLRPGSRVDRYVLVRELGRGGQGAVWLADDPMAPGEARALKLVQVSEARHTDLERIRREARALAQLEHPCLVRCHGMFEDLRLGVLGVCMDFVDGPSLAHSANDALFSSMHRVAVLVHVAGALAFVHRQGIVHRDLKPENVLLTRGFFEHPEDPSNLKLVDFGIARVQGQQALTQLDHLVGTVAYLAPERLVPRFYSTELPATASDVFAYGVMAYELLARTHPTGLPRGSTPSEYAIEYQRAAELGAPWPPSVPDGAWGELIRDALALRADRRIPDGETLARRCHEAGGLGIASDEFDPKRTVPAAPRALGRASTPPVDAFAPTQIGASMGARSSAPPTFEARPRPSSPASVTGAAPASRPPSGVTERSASAVVLPGPGGRTEDPAPLRERALAAPPGAESTAPARSGLSPLAIGYLLVGAAAVAVFIAFFSDIVSIFGGSRAPEPLPPLPEVARSAPLPASPPVEDAGADVDAALALPANCDPDAGLCDCCPTNRDCSPGSCEDPLPPDERFALRLRDLKKAGRSVWKQERDLQVCIGTTRSLVLDAGAPDQACTRVAELDHPYGTAPHASLVVSVRELTQPGLSVRVFEPANAAPVADVLEVKQPALTRAALCKGLTFTMTAGEDRIQTVELTLDAPDGDPAEKCP